MRFDVRGRNLSVTAALRDHVIKRLRFALERVAPRLRRVAVQVADMNGPRGGVDKRCYVRVVLPGRTITINELDRDLYVAIDRAAERAGRAVERTLERLRAA